MTPEQFLARLTKQPPAAAYLFLGQEAYQRRLCKKALAERVLPADARAEGFTQVDLETTRLSEVLDDARSLSLFSGERLIWICSAELALPRRVSTTADPGAPESTADNALVDYLKAPTPGTVLVFECSRFDFAGDDRAKLDRVQRFYSAIPAVVEFRHYTPESSRFLAQELIKQHGPKLGRAELAALLEAVAGDPDRLAAEIEKLSLFVGNEHSVTMEHLRELVPDAAQSTIFALVSALARRDRRSALQSLDILVRDGEYLPLALTFLSTQFRLALAAKEARLKSAQQAQGFFSGIGVRMWRERAEQVMITADAFPKELLSNAVSLLYETDKKFRDGYRDERTVMEALVLALTAHARSNV